MTHASTYCARIFRECWTNNVEGQVYERDACAETQEKLNEIVKQALEKPSNEWNCTGEHGEKKFFILYFRQ